MRKRVRRIPAFMNSGKGSLLTRLTLSGDFSFWLRLTKNPRGFCLLLIPRERVSKWNYWRLQSVNSKGYKINLFVNFHFTTHIKYFNNLFSAKPMRRRPWESRSKFGMGSTQSQFSICNSQFSNSILNSQAQFSILRYGINSSSTTGQSALLVLAACISARSISQIYF